MSISGSLNVVNANRIEGCGGNGLKLPDDNADRNAITDNVITNCSSYGVTIEGSTNDNNAVVANIVYNNTIGQINDAGTGTTSANNVTS